MAINDLLARFDGEAALIAPEMGARFQSCLVQAVAVRDSIAEMQAASPAVMSDDFWPASDSWLARYRPYVIVDGVLQIPVKGVLLNDYSFSTGWATGYDYIWRAFERGMGDLNVKGIALVVDSPGGMVAGNFSLVDKMFAYRGTKPVRGFASEHAYSAAYSIISVADPGQISVTRTGGVGSIGVVTSHVNMSKLMDDIGYEITFIFAGKHKVDGNPYAALSPEVKARIQERIDALYDVFVSTVARNRDLDEQAVRDTEALTFMASEALSNGLADKIGDLDDALAEYAADLTPSEEEDQMSTQDNNPAAVDQAALDAAVATATDAGRKEGASAERTRITAIIGCDAAAERPKAALSAALKTDMTVEQATAFLADLPAEAAPKASAETNVEPTVGAPAGMFEAAMDKSGGAGLTPTAGSTGDEDEDLAAAKSTVALARSLGMAGLTDAPKH